MIQDIIDSIEMEYYMEKFEKQLFDFSTVKSFLIYVREYIKDNNNQLALEIADTVAHGDRDNGLVFKNLKTSIDNNYQLNKFGKVDRYHGIQEKEWYNYWSKFFKQFNITLNKDSLYEVSLCLVSILQNTKYEIKDDMKKIISTGHLGLIKGSDHSLCLETHEDKDDA